MIGKEVDFCIWLNITLAWKVSRAVCESWLQKDPAPSVSSRRCSRNSSDAGPGQLVPLGGRPGGQVHPGTRTQTPWVAGGEAAVVCPSLSPQLPEPREQGCSLDCRSCRPRQAATLQFAPPARCGPPWTAVCHQAHKAGELDLHATGTCFHTPAPTPSPHATCAGPEPAQVQVTSFLLTRRSVHRSLLCSVPRCPSPGDKSLILLARPSLKGEEKHPLSWCSGGWQMGTAELGGATHRQWAGAEQGRGWWGRAGPQPVYAA